MMAGQGPGKPPVALVAAAGPFVASPRDLDAWAVRAAPGATCLYARAPRLPGGGVAERARQMEGRGMVRLAQGRDGADRGLFAYRAERTAAPFAAPVPAPAGRLSADDARLLALLAAAAKAGARCPGNRELAARLGWKREATVPNALARLRAAGAIRVWHADDGPAHGAWRVVEIVATGAATLAPGGAGE